MHGLFGWIFRFFFNHVRGSGSSKYRHGKEEETNQLLKNIKYIYKRSSFLIRRCGLGNGRLFIRTTRVENGVALNHLTSFRPSVFKGPIMFFLFIVDFPGATSLNL